MSNTPLPLLLEAEALHKALATDDTIRVVDLSSAASFAAGHIPGAVPMAPAALQCGIKPATGKLPRPEALRSLLSDSGLTPQHHVVACDDEGGGWAGRLLWTLDILGHRNYSYLNGGIHAWRAAGLATESGTAALQKTDYPVDINHSAIAEADHIVAQLGNNDFAIWDARSPEEYRGEKQVSQRSGHIPGAINIDWLELIDRDNHTRLIDLKALQQRLKTLGLGADKNIVTHCQSHHRSSLTWLVMKILGYPNVKAYPGSWGEWGNLPNTPIEV